MVASAVKDSKKAEVIGQTTNGFGVEEKVYPLSDGSAIIIAVANYVTNDSPVFTNTGIAPFKEVVLSDDKRARLDRKDLYQEDDDQLQAAIEVLGGKTAAQIAMEQADAEQSNEEAEAQE